MARLLSNFSLKTLKEGDTYDPVRNLWRNVLIVGIQDLLKKKKLHFTFDIKGKYSVEEMWFHHEDFKWICEFAQLNHYMVKKKVFKEISKLEKKYGKRKTNLSKMQREWVHSREGFSGTSDRHNGTMSAV